MLSLQLAGFFVCGLNLTLPSNASILKYILCPCGTLPKIIQRSLPELLKWVQKQAGMNIVASDLVTRNDFVSVVIKLNISKISGMNKE